MLSVLRVEVFDEFAEYKDIKNVIVICDKLDKKIEKVVADFVLTMPKLVDWQVVDYILEELDLDFDQVTAGANCYSGVQNRTFNTVKYGVLHTEFSYCKSNGTQSLRIYNSEVDQKLRDPNPGELPEIDSYGYIKNSSRSYV